MLTFDSIPAIVGITREAYIVFVANAFALLGLRALLPRLGVFDRLVYRSAGLATILVFIGAKLVLHYVHKHWESVPEISAFQSLVVIASILAVVTVASIVKTRRDPSTCARVKSLRHHRQSGRS